jgi:hypothetical protein
MRPIVHVPAAPTARPAASHAIARHMLAPL